MQIFAELCTSNVEVGVVEEKEIEKYQYSKEIEGRLCSVGTYDLFYNANTVVCWNTVLLSA